jgi:hypothetical protein
MDNVPKINTLPKSMAERAMWAREEYIRNPQKSQTCDDMLIWCFCEQDNLWYSIAGNYSQFSPIQKRIKQEERDKRYEELQQNAEKMALNYYESVIYVGSVRKAILERDNYTCQMCFLRGGSKLHIHHILKRVEGGGDTQDNLITVCPKCHRKADTSEYNPAWV